MKEQIKKILMDNSCKIELLGTREESIEAVDGERIIDNEDIEIIAKLINQMLQEKIQLSLTKD